MSSFYQSNDLVTSMIAVYQIDLARWIQISYITPSPFQLEWIYESVSSY